MRSRTVCRATPRALAARSRGTQPSGALPTTLDRISSSRRMCQSPPGTIWVVGDEAGAKRAVDGHLGLSENPQVVAAVAGAISQAAAALPLLRFRVESTSRPSPLAR